METSQKRRETVILWKMNDWKGKAELKIDNQVDESQTLKYFTDIFQSPKTKTHPTINKVICNVETCNFYVPILGNTPSMDGLENAIKKLGKGTSIDGLPTSVVKILAYSMKEIILTSIQRVFLGD